jgi:hypothetical protein
MLHMRLKDVAAELDVSITYLRRLCRQNGFPNWPGKQVRSTNTFQAEQQHYVLFRFGVDSISSCLTRLELPLLLIYGATQIRFMNGIRRNDLPLPWAGLAGPSQLAKIAEAKKKEDDMTGIQAPVANHHPGQELITLNLIDKVGSSSSSELS